MRGQLIARLILITLVSASAGGCGTTAPARFFNLDSTAVADGAPPATHSTVIVGPVSIPASVDQPQIVVQVAPNRVEIEEFNRWAAPLSDSIARVVAGDLVVLLGTSEVVAAQLGNFNPDYQVTIAVQRFDSIRGQAAVLEAMWAVRIKAGGSTRTGRTVARETVNGDGFDMLAAAHSRALAKMSGDIAAVIRAEAAAKS